MSRARLGFWNFGEEELTEPIEADFLGGGGEVLWAEKEAEVLEAVQFLERVKATIYGT